MNRHLLRGAAVFAVACTMFSAGLAWFSIPVGISGVGTDHETIEVTRPWITPYYQAVAVAVPILLFVLRRRKRGVNFSLAVASLWFAALLAYPYCVMVWDPLTAGNATWLEAQHRDLVWRGGDMSTSLEYYTAGALDHLCLTDAPQDVSPTLMSDWQLPDSSLACLPDLVDRLGYSNKFLEFIRLGWSAALIGGILLILWMCSTPDSVDLSRALRASAFSTAAMLAVCLFAWSWSFLAARKLAVAAEHTTRGEYREARDGLRMAAALLPVLSQDSYFIAQTGLVEDALGEQTPAARLYRANVLEQSGRLQRADFMYAQLAAEGPGGTPLRREACRGLLRAAIDDLNAGRNNEAMRCFESILAVDPCNLKALYGMQLACLHTGRYQTAVALASRIDAVYGCFQFLDKQAVQFASHTIALASDYEMGDANAAVVEARKVLDQ